jgi:hypothetical protein
MERSERRWGHRLRTPVGLAVSLVALVCASSAAAASNTGFEWGNGVGSYGNPNPVTLPGGVGVAELSAGHAGDLALGADGDIYAWGSNTSGQLGNGANGGDTPTQTELPNGIKAISVSTAEPTASRWAPTAMSTPGV